MLAQLLIFHLAAVWLVQNMGRPGEIVDLGYALTPDLTGSRAVHLFHDVVITSAPVVAAAWAGKTAEFGKLMLLVFVFRHFMNALTILPPPPSCDLDKPWWRTLLFGGCFDKIPSGHFASVLVITSLLPMSGPLLVAIRAVSAFVILSLRHHYSIDLAVAWLLVNFVMSAA